MDQRFEPDHRLPAFFNLRQADACGLRELMMVLSGDLFFDGSAERRDEMLSITRVVVPAYETPPPSTL